MHRIRIGVCISREVTDFLRDTKSLSINWRCRQLLGLENGNNTGLHSSPPLPFPIENPYWVELQLLAHWQTDTPPKADIPRTLSEQSAEIEPLFRCTQIRDPCCTGTSATIDRTQLNVHRLPKTIEEFKIYICDSHLSVSCLNSRHYGIDLPSLARFPRARR